MFAIEITEENLPKILQTPGLDALDKHVLKYYLNKRRYFISGYVSPRGDLVGWTTLPHYLLDDNFEYDPVKASTDWDQIVRK